MAEVTFRFRAESRVTYARALLALTVRARAGGDFTFGPLQLRALEEHGLAVSGSEADLRGWADDFLAEVPGLYRDE